MASLLNNEKYSLYFQKVRLMYRRPEIRASLEVILSVFTVAILIFAAIRPTLTNIVSLQKKIEDQEVINKKADNKMAQLVNAQNQLNSLSNSLYLFDNAIPDTFSYSDSSKRLEYIARKNNLSIGSLGFPGYTLLSGGKASPDWAAKIMKSDGNILLAPILFSVNGRPQNVLTFLREIENMDRLALLNNISLTKQAGLNKAEDTLKASGQVTFYFYTQK